MEKMPIYVIINETHSLLDEQKALIEKLRKDAFLCDDLHKVVTVKVPAKGWTLEQMKEKGKEMRGSWVIFVSPIPFLIKYLSRDMGTGVRIFHNDNREKKELPNGKIIHTVSRTGWQLV
ncbi:MAG TPA: hypothetical protein GX712_06435 [Bacteroidales bacterium]|nr:hypothetical protein [Bacteroidales bacterium]